MMLGGRILIVLTALFMLMDGVMKIVKPVQVLEANIRLGYPVSTLSGIGIALIVCRNLPYPPNCTVGCRLADWLPRRRSRQQRARRVGDVRDDIPRPFCRPRLGWPMVTGSSVAEPD